MNTTSPQLYAVWVTSVVINCASDMITVIDYWRPNVHGYGSILDKNGGLFTVIDLVSFFFFIYADIRLAKATDNFWFWSSAYLATFLAVPDAIAQFNGLLYYINYTFYDYPFGVAALVFLLWNLYLYRKPRS